MSGVLNSVAQRTNLVGENRLELLLFRLNSRQIFAINVFKVLMAIYSFQGISILSHFFDLWGLKGIFRMLSYGLALFFMMPLVLSVGFFDLWFDFRGKFTALKNSK